MSLFRVYLGMQKCRLWASYSLKGDIYIYIYGLPRGHIGMHKCWVEDLHFFVAKA